jgi:ribosomal protein L37E
MGDSFQTLIDTGATLDDASALAQRVVAELVEAGYISSDRSNCTGTLGEDGFPPALQVLRHLKKPNEMPMTLRTNGLEVTTGRSVHLNAFVDRMTCALCGATASDLTRLPWSEAIGEWYEGGAGLLSCPACGQESDVTQWHYEPACGFGNLSFTFWNWPPFTSEYWVRTPIEAIEGALGRPCVLVSGRI